MQTTSTPHVLKLNFFAAYFKLVVYKDFLFESYIRIFRLTNALNY